MRHRGCANGCASAASIVRTGVRFIRVALRQPQFCIMAPLTEYALRRVGVRWREREACGGWARLDLVETALVTISMACGIEFHAGMFEGACECLCTNQGAARCGIRRPGHRHAGKGGRLSLKPWGRGHHLRRLDAILRRRGNRSRTVKAAKSWANMGAAARGKSKRPTLRGITVESRQPVTRHARQVGIGKHERRFAVSPRDCRQTPCGTYNIVTIAEPAIAVELVGRHTRTKRRQAHGNRWPLCADMGAACCAS